jgi:hypothetical protein
LAVVSRVNLGEGGLAVIEVGINPQPTNELLGYVIISTKQGMDIDCGRGGGGGIDFGYSGSGLEPPFLVGPDVGEDGVFSLGQEIYRVIEVDPGGDELLGGTFEVHG